MTADWQRRADELAAEAVAAGEPTAWFERLFAEGAAGVTTMPWDRRDPHPLLRDWADARGLTGIGAEAGVPSGRGRAVVPGCGLGADAGFLAGAGFDVTGFDVAATALAGARERFPGVDFRQADLFGLPPAWRGGFDLVVDVYTVQALPRPVRPAVIAALRDLVAPGGTLLAIQAVLGPEDDPDEGPPWPLTRAEIESFADGLTSVRVETVNGFWRGEFSRGAVRRGVVG